MAGFLGEVITEILGELGGLFAAGKLGLLGKIAGKVFTNEQFKGFVVKKTGEIFGQVDETGKTLEEELLTVDLINYLGCVGPEVDAFISELRKQERGDDKVMAFRVFLASGIKKGSHQVKEFIPRPDNKGKPTEQTMTLLDVEWGKKFIGRFLAKRSFEERVKFLEDNGVFSTMKKVVPPNPTVIKGKAFLKRTKNSGIELIKTQSEKISAAMKENAVDLRTNSEKALDEAKARYEASKRR